MVFNRETPVRTLEQRPACRHDWTQDEVLALYRPAVQRPDFPGPDGAPRAFRRQRGPDLDLAVDQDRRLPGRLRLLPAERAFRHGPQVAETDVERGGARRGGASEIGRGVAVLHGGGVARAQGQRGRRSRRAGGRCQSPRARDLCDPRHADPRLRPSGSRRPGLDYYNHNLDTSESYYDRIITTRTYQDRLDTLAHVREAGIHVCCGGILGMGEGVEDHAAMLCTLANLPEHPESVPINMLVRVEGTPLADAQPLDPLDFVRTIAVARIMMPASFVRLSAGREAMSDELQALCFLAGANSIFFGEKLLTTPNPAMPIPTGGSLSGWACGR